MNPIEQLFHTKLETEIYHPDGHGHVQVETVFHNFGESPPELLEQINRQNLWDEFYQRIEAQSEKWRYDLLEHFTVEKTYSILYRMKLLETASSDIAINAIIHDADTWLWSNETSHYLDKVIAFAEHQLTVLDPDALFIEFETEQLTALIDKLRTINQLKTITGN
jgi:hypothetical protein